MYTRPDVRHREVRQDVFIPENYSGTAFNDQPPTPTEKETLSVPEDSVEVDDAIETSAENSKKRNGLFAGLSGEDLLLLGIILLLSQEDAGDEILPILLMLLFFRK